MDKKRNSEALEILLKLNQDEPQRYDVKVALASCYAGLGGLQIYEFYDLFYEAMFSRPWIELAESKQQVKPFKIMSDESNKDGMHNVNRLILRIKKIFESLTVLTQLLERLPAISTVENQRYVEQALFILDSLDSIKPADAVFRALIRTSYMKRIVAIQFDMDGPDFLELPDEGCFLHPDRLMQFVDRLLTVVSLVVGDVQTAFPKDQSSLDPFAKKLTDTRADIKDLVSVSKIPADSTKQRRIHLGPKEDCML